MRKTIFKRIFCLLLALMLSVGVFAPLCFAENALDSNIEGVIPDDIVRIGWFDLNGSQYMANEDMRAGYYYDIYKAITRYNNITYEFIPLTWSECLESLKPGEGNTIDVLANIEYTEERAKYYDFVSVPVGESYSMIVTLNDKAADYASFSGFSGKTVAAVKGSYCIDEFSALCEKNSLKCSITEYPTPAECDAALRSGNADAVLTSNMQRIDSDLVCVYCFSPVNVFLAVTKGNSELLSKLNYALQDIAILNPNLLNTIYNKYFLDNLGKSFSLQENERERLSELKTVRVYLDKNSSYLGETMTDEFYGVIKAYVNCVAARLGVGVKFLDSSSGTINELIASGIVDIVPDFYYDHNYASRSGFGISSPYVDIQTYTVSKNDSIDKNSTVAAVSGSVIANFYVLQNYKAENIIWCKSEKDCLRAVKSGKADFTIINSYIVKEYLNLAIYKRLIVDKCDFHYNLCYAFADGTDTALITAFSRALISVSHFEQMQIELNSSIAVSSNDRSVAFHLTLAVVLLACVALSAMIAAIVFKRREKAAKADVEKFIYPEMPSMPTADKTVVEMPAEKPVEIGTSTATVGLKDIDVNIDNLKGKRVLLAEDNELNAMITSTLLEKAEMLVEIAENGEAALKLFSESEVDYYDVILMDVTMPVMDGREATKAIRSLERDDALEIPIIALTASSFCEDIKSCLDAGMDAHLSKPIEPQKLFLALAENVG